jgi:SAM-dependent methyltransferase
MARVYTREREVNAMLDLVKCETERIDSRFLEPACGNGNFLAEILRRKLNVVKRRYRKSALVYERYAVVAVASLYGIDILEDNVLECRRRLAGIVEQCCASFFCDEFMPAVRYILERNIIWCDALSLQTVGDPPQPIVFFGMVDVQRLHD